MHFEAGSEFHTATRQGLAEAGTAAPRATGGAQGLRSPAQLLTLVHMWPWAGVAAGAPAKGQSLAPSQARLLHVVPASLGLRPAARPVQCWSERMSTGAGQAWGMSVSTEVLVLSDPTWASTWGRGAVPPGGSCALLGAASQPPRTPRPQRGCLQAKLDTNPICSLPEKMPRPALSAVSAPRSIPHSSQPQAEVTGGLLRPAVSAAGG